MFCVVSCTSLLKQVYPSTLWYFPMQLHSDPVLMSVRLCVSALWTTGVSETQYWIYQHTYRGAGARWGNITLSCPSSKTSCKEQTAHVVHMVNVLISAFLLFFFDSLWMSSAPVSPLPGAPAPCAAPGPAERGPVPVPPGAYGGAFPRGGWGRLHHPARWLGESSEHEMWGGRSISQCKLILVILN